MGPLRPCSTDPRPWPPHWRAAASRVRGSVPAVSFVNSSGSRAALRGHAHLALVGGDSPSAPPSSSITKPTPSSSTSRRRWQFACRLRLSAVGAGGDPDGLLPALPRRRRARRGAGRGLRDRELGGATGYRRRPGRDRRGHESAASRPASCSRTSTARTGSANLRGRCSPVRRPPGRDQSSRGAKRRPRAPAPAGSLRRAVISGWAPIAQLDRATPS